MTSARDGNIGLNLMFAEPADMSLLGLSSTFYDFGLLYDWAVLVTLPDYSDFRFSHYFWYRRGRPIRPYHRLYVQKLRHESPVGLDLLIPALASAAGVPWALLQSIEKVSNWRLNRRKLEAEVKDLEARSQERLIAAEKVEAERDEAMYRKETARIDFESRHAQISQRTDERDADDIEKAIIRRLEKDELTIVDANFIELSGGTEMSEIEAGSDRLS